MRGFRGLLSFCLTCQIYKVSFLLIDWLIVYSWLISCGQFLSPLVCKASARAALPSPTSVCDVLCLPVVMQWGISSIINDAKAARETSHTLILVIQLQRYHWYEHGKLSGDLSNFAWYSPLSFILACQFWWPRVNFKVTAVSERWNWKLWFCSVHTLYDC